MMIQDLSDYQEFEQFMSNVPLPIIIAMIIFAIAIFILVCILIYYIFYGIYKLLSGLFKGGKKVTEGAVKALSSKPQHVDSSRSVPAQQASTSTYLADSLPAYCSGCGSDLTESMKEQLRTSGKAYCALCGHKMEL